MSRTAIEFYTLTLPNGIRCIHRRVKSAAVHCALTIGSGSRDELTAEYGVAHLAEHCLFKGTSRRRAYHINCRLENLGGELNAFTTKEETVIHATTLKGDFSKAVELIGDIVFNSRFPQAEVAREKEVVLEEIASFRETPSEQIFDDFEELIFAGSPLAHNILGTKSSVRRLSRESIAGFISRTYNTDRMVFSSVGNIPKEQFRRVAERYFGGVGASPRTFQRTKPTAVAPFSETRRKGAGQAHCVMGTPACDLYDPRRLSLSLLVNTLGGPAANSILNLALRERNALTYAVEAGYTPFCDTGLATIYFATEKNNLERCIELVNKELDAIRTRGLTPRQLSMAKRQFAGQLALSLESNENYNLSMGKSVLAYGVVDALPQIVERVRRITAEELTDVAREVFDNMSMLIFK